VLSAGVLRGCGTHILVSATCLVVMVLILTCIRVSWVHVLVNVAACRRWWAVVVRCWVIGWVVRWVRGIVIKGRCWGRRKVVGIRKVTGVIRTCGGLTWTVPVGTVLAAWAVAALAIGRLILV
jgi:hypothetical protein